MLYASCTFPGTSIEEHHVPGSVPGTRMAVTKFLDGMVPAGEDPHEDMKTHGDIPHNCISGSLRQQPAKRVIPFTSTC